MWLHAIESQHILISNINGSNLSKQNILTYAGESIGYSETSFFQSLITKAIISESVLQMAKGQIALLRMNWGFFLNPGKVSQMCYVLVIIFKQKYCPIPYDDKQIWFSEFH